MEAYRPQTEQAGPLQYHLLYAHGGWDVEADEPVAGGRFVEDFTSMREAMNAYRAYLPAARRLWGAGELVITDPRHKRVYPPFEDILNANAVRQRSNVGTN